MKPFFKYPLKCLPIFTAIFALWVIIICVQIIDEIGFDLCFLALLSLEVFFNWFAILVTNRNCTDIENVRIHPRRVYNNTEYANYHYMKRYKDKLAEFIHRLAYQKPLSPNYSWYDFRNQESVVEVWTSKKCCLKSREPRQYCPVCKNCVLGRDHHCFLLGACIGKQNMQHFIIFLYYTSLACLYAHVLLCDCMNLYNESWYIIFQHLFPISFTKWLIGQELSSNLTGILLMNVTGITSIMTFIFSIAYLYRSISANGQMLNKTLSEKLIYICRCDWNIAWQNLLFPITLRNYLLRSLSNN